MIPDRYYYRPHRMLWLSVVFIAGLVLLMPVLENLPSGLEAFAGKTVQLTGTVRESREGNSYIWLKLENQNEVIYVSLPYGLQQEEENTIWYPAGTRLKITGTVEYPKEQRNPGGFDEKAWLLSKNVRMKLHADEVLVLQEPQGIWRLSWKVQEYIKAAAGQYLNDQQSNLALALLLGEKQQLDDTFYRLTQQMGIAHIFAVSGLHVGFAGTLLLMLFRFLRIERSWVSFIGLAAGLSFYCLITGLVPSAIRAALMLLLAALSLRILRPPSPVDFLALAAILLLLDNPFLLYTAGFQLSFGVTLSLLIFVRPLQKRLGWIRLKMLREGIAVALAASLGSLPLTAWHFYTMSLFSPFYNLILVPVVSVLVPVLLITFLITALFPAFCKLLFLPAAVLLELLYRMTHFFAAMAGTGQWNTGRPDWIAVICYLLFLVFLYQWLQNRESAQSGNSLAVYSTCCLLAAILFIFPHPPAQDELLYLDAGQGSCAILRTQEGETVIFDGGTQQRELASCLAWYGINNVKAIILSHGDADHTGGLEQVLETVSVQYLCIEETQMRRGQMLPILAAAEKTGADVKPVRTGARISLQDGLIQLRAIDDGGNKTNSRELAASAIIGDTVIAFPGDLGIAGIQTYLQGCRTITVWTVPHHGSRFSASEDVYRQLQQKGVRLAVISAGAENRYGHPHREVLQYLKGQNIPVCRTDLQNAVLIQLNMIEKDASPAVCYTKGLFM